MSHTWPRVLASLVAGTDLDADTARWAMGQILSGEASAAQIAGFAVALRQKQETLPEVEGLVAAMYAEATTLRIDDRVVDIVGTGGDMAKTVNISSMSAVTIAGAGVGVVKHGNRAASSQSGTADVFERLGVRLDLPAERIADVYAEAGITFCFAPVFHPALRFAGPVRRELGIPTIFNFLGPLTNPAHASAAAIGCADARMAPLMAGVMASRGADAFVFRGDDGLDEITVSATTQVWLPGHDGRIVAETFDPRELGFELAASEALRGGDPEFNADVFARVIDGESGPVRDAVLLNAGAGIAAHAAAPGTFTERLADGVRRAAESIDSGAARATLDRWSQITQRLAG
ncbi:anthranilate phosphoribosyltransferase [Aeromicrobium sp. YIM 150415]|uniref:anthranilate phosphoribosyltransferase n=1 Tax=Aeromicrobium sp. YIM 150415 TaxID=2803912 RepID=UPI0019660DBB|nr:anthranilate phosphoribosyltransferase [Aeromicrobium sp. YIM 150415]MBM9464351.1 anthranilate phosphoribosyltransferase [Aeromicrobium sp. YIM 150415]